MEDDQLQSLQVHPNILEGQTVYAMFSQHAQQHNVQPTTARVKAETAGTQRTYRFRLSNPQPEFARTTDDERRE